MRVHFSLVFGYFDLFCVSPSVRGHDYCIWSCSARVGSVRAVGRLKCFEWTSRENSNWWWCRFFSSENELGVHFLNSQFIFWTTSSFSEVNWARDFLMNFFRCCHSFLNAAQTYSTRSISVLDNQVHFPRFLLYCAKQCRNQTRGKT